ncbi:MAG: diphthamide biosynthesis enzyme Dph2 [Candidatus Micrarchaeota archaeon]
MRILLQFPEGLKKLAFEEAGKLEREGHEVFVSSAECFGACDLALEEARAIGAKKIIHWGHSDFGVKTRIPVEYREYSIGVEMESIIKKALPELSKFQKIGIITTVQHIPQLHGIKTELEQAGKIVFIGKGNRAKYAGQVLGCDFGAAKQIESDSDCILYFGGGLFHAMVEVHKPVLRVDPFSGQIEWMDEKIENARKSRRGAMNALILAKNVGILVSTKPGQKDARAAIKVKNVLDGFGKRCLVLVADKVNFETLRNFGSFDCYVNTACPRISDDFGLAGKPVINFHDAMLVAKMLVKK